MKKVILLVALLLTIQTIQSQKQTKCLIETSLGEIEIELYDNKAPITVQNFLQYVDSTAYNNSSFFRTCTKENEAERTIKIQVIQGGNITEETVRAPIKIETTAETEVLHKNGTISMARSEPNSATSSFFICINEQPELNFGGKRNPDGHGFAAFGQVTKGMDVVLKIQSQKNKNQQLLEPIEIHAITRVSN
ncbi:peptidylprolyl isomerase [Aureibaculum sp. A20]|uniref:Peptidyl-prolyl cis-trans isomerase n=1 Tax=Aureibaculum flavum TaxID=2795986 RepID=A0ABS0WSC6_9FLAO|nr:peptidylprolyl isomerase [Aureibaculum flavum]MBJ2174878.1 peptidylprolyl isomerase [Aureibaculum flavum]